MQQLKGGLVSGHGLCQSHQLICLVLSGDRGRSRHPFSLPFHRSFVPSAARHSALGFGVLTSSSSSNGSSSCIGELVPHSDAICAIACASVAMLIKEY